ncbi:MAG: tetratricopeptide repeat protein [Caldimonas sp.]
MKALAALLTLALINGCASAPPMPPVADLFHDALFAPATVPIESEQAMALSGPMRSFIDEHLSRARSGVDRRRWLMDALYRKDGLRLEYDATMTRTAAQAFESRSGNCLALVMMTGAFAKAMGLSVHYQVVLGEEGLDRAGDLAISIGHVNLTLDDRASRLGNAAGERDSWTIDFLAGPENGRSRIRAIEEHTVIAMFLNNRAVESLVHDRTDDDAYWWAREAIRRDPELLAAYVTLGVIYRSRHQPALAEAVLARVNQREPENTQALANRLLVLRDLGRHEEAAAVQQRLDRLDPHPHFADFRLGMTALRERRFEDARRLFEREIDRSPDHHEFHFWLAVTYAELSDPKRAAAQLARAMEVSTTRRNRDLYAGKLDRLKALQVR